VSAGQICSETAVAHLALHLTQAVGPATFERLVEAFGSADAALGASVSQLQSVPGIGRKTAEAIARASDGRAVKRELALAERLGVRIVCRADGEFPKPLHYISDPPICLYQMSQWRAEDALAVAVVGSRRPTYYGTEQAGRFATLLANAGFTVVSGMARGVDQAAHTAALRAGGRTIAVLGCGLKYCYPPESTELRDRIARNGAVLSELPLEAPPEAKNFPRRNRLIAGLSLGVLVVEAGQRSGALITARLANEYNREVFAVPGRVDTPQADGTNALIRDGQAKLVTGLQDILAELGEAGRIIEKSLLQAENNDSAQPAEANEQNEQKVALTGAEAKVYRALTTEPMHLDEICEATSLPAGQVAAVLTMLQVRGLVKQLPGNLFVRTAAPDR